MNNITTKQEILEDRQKLEKDIYKLIKEFEKNHTIKVYAIYISNYTCVPNYVTIESSADYD